MKMLTKLVSIVILVAFGYSVGLASEPAQSIEPAPPSVRMAAPPAIMMAKPAMKSAKKTKAKGKQKAPSLKYATDPIEINCPKLPQRYLGHDLRVIYDALEKRKSALSKGEFETTEKYNARIQALENKPLIGKLGKSDVFALSVPTGFDYDADKLLLKVKMDSRKLYLSYSIEDKLTLPGPELYNRERSYVGSNAFGASVDAADRFIATSKLVALNPEVFGMKNPSQYYGGIIYKFENFPIEKAITSKNNLRVLVLFKLLDPLISEGHHGSSATYDSPSGYYETHKNVYAQVIESWVYNIETGEILLKENYKKTPEGAALDTRQK